MPNLIKIDCNPPKDYQELLDIIIDAIDMNATNMDYATILGVLEMVKDHIKEEMNN